MITLLLFLAAPQDLWSRMREPVPVESKTRNGRLDLSVGPMLDPERCTIKPGKVGVDLKVSPDFACGTFDVAASFRALLNRNLKDELLNGLAQELRAELASSAMVLACQVSPTMCDALKHYKIVAGEALTMQFNQCRAVEAASAGLNEALRARAIKQCLAEQQAKGIPLDQAMAECQKSGDLRGLAGEKVKEIDLAQEIGKSLGLTPESKSLLADLAGGLKLGTKGVNGELKMRPVGESFDRFREQFSAGWSRAVAESAGGTLKPEQLRTLVPTGAPPASPAEVQRLARMSEADRRVVIGALSSAMALQETARHLADAQAAIESADMLAQDPAIREALRTEAARLSSEFRRLREEYELSELVSMARLRADGRAQEATARSLQRNTEAWRRSEESRRVDRATAPWGSGCPVEKKK